LRIRSRAILAALEEARAERDASHDGSRRLNRGIRDSIGLAGLARRWHLR